MMESNGQAEAPGREGAAPGRQPAAAGPARSARASVSAADGAPGGASGAGRRSWSRFWLILVTLLIVNWLLASALLGGASGTTVSYSFFVKRLEASNVEIVTATGNAIEGTFKRPVSYIPPLGGRAVTVTKFNTERPTFADDGLFQELMAKGVIVNASQGTPLWQRFLQWFGPALVLGGLLAWRWRGRDVPGGTTAAVTAPAAARAGAEGAPAPDSGHHQPTVINQR